MNKKLFFLPLLGISVFIFSWCDVPQSDNFGQAANVVVYEVCQDLSLPCWGVYDTEIDRYSLEAPLQFRSRAVDISGDRKIPDTIGEYFLQNGRTVDVYNMADGIEWTLVGYTKDPVNCSVLWTWELDEEFIPTGKWVTSLRCFEQ